MEDISLEGLSGESVEYGVDKVFLYPRDQFGVFRKAIPWSGVSRISKKRVGKGLSSIYYDGVRVDVLEESTTSPYDLDLRIDCFTYPEVLDSHIGDLVNSDIGFIELSRKSNVSFGLSYRTRVGENEYRIHVYPNVKATPSEISYQTMSNSPDLVEFSFDLAILNSQHYTGSDSFVGAIIDTSRSSKKLRDKVESVLYKNPIYLSSLSDDIKKATENKPFFRLYSDGTWVAEVDEKRGYGYFDKVGDRFEIIVPDEHHPEYLDEYTWSLDDLSNY